MKAEPSDPIWSRWYLGAWALWAAFAVVCAFIGGPDTRPIWYALIGSFALLEGVGAVARSDRMPMLTEVFGRYVPGFVTFSVLALAMWRVSRFVPGWVLYPAAAWQTWHFVATYHGWQKLGGKS